MKTTIAILLLGAVMVLAEEKYDGHTIEEIIADDNLRKDYFECLMDTKECTPGGEELKTSLPIALTKDCEGCTERQKLATQKMIEFVSKNRPDHWTLILKKFDPEGIYISKNPELAVAS